LLPCASYLLPLEFRQSINLKNFIMYGDCFAEKCKKKADTEEITQNLELGNREDRKGSSLEKGKAIGIKNTFNLADVVLIMSNLNENVVFPCKIQKLLANYYLNSDMNIYWQIETSEKQLNMTFSENNLHVFIDELFNLNINKIQYSDIGIYKCYSNEEIKNVFLLKINYKFLDEILNFLNHFGVFLTVSTLLIVSILSFLK